MKNLLPLIALLLMGCSSLPSHLRKAIPEGSWESVDATVTGKFSSTTVDAKNVVKDGKRLDAEDLHIRHSNVWIPLVEINAKGHKPPPGGREAKE